MALLVAFLVFTCGLFAQNGLPGFNKERARINQTGFLVLSAWSVANIGSGIIGLSAGGQAKYFHQMNLLWGGVNLLIALPGYLGARKTNGDLSLAASVTEQSRVEKTFIFNAGLDLAYMAGGAWFLEKANSRSDPDRFRGYGKSILVQGSFLLLFDAVMFITHNRHGKKLYKALNGMQLAPNSIGFIIPLGRAVVATPARPANTL
ncbi:MAG: hypothetical protein ABI813_01715 [Bacteroidota bacterium]